MCDRFPRKFEFKLHVSPRTFVVNIKFPRATYHTIVPSTEELYCLISEHPLAQGRLQKCESKS